MQLFSLFWVFHPWRTPCLVIGQGMKKIGHSSQSLLTLEQVAEYLNVNKFTVYRLLAQKDLPAFKVGNQWRFKRELVDAWLKKNAKNPPGHSATKGTT